MKTKVDVKLGTIGALTIITLFFAAIVGWVLNIIQLAHTEAMPITTMFILRIIGIFVPPIGSIMGWL